MDKEQKVFNYKKLRGRGLEAWAAWTVSDSIFTKEQEAERRDKAILESRAAEDRLTKGRGYKVAHVPRYGWDNFTAPDDEIGDPYDNVNNLRGY